MTRQGMISVYAPTDNLGNHVAEGEHIIFNQPFNNFGLNYEFSYTRSYFYPFIDLSLKIYNISDEIVNLFNYDYGNFGKRPKVEIHGGYTDYRMSSEADADILESNLNLLFVGFPYYVASQKIPGGRYLDVKLSDIMSDKRNKKLVKTFRKGSMLVNEILTGILNESGIKYDLALLNTAAFSGVKTEIDLFYNGDFILSGILPKLSQQYGFYFYTNTSGALIFAPSGTQRKGSIQAELTIENGLIEYPTQINNTQYSVKTFFGAPSIFSPGDYVKIVSDQFAAKSATGLIIDGSYRWGTDDAEIVYKFGEDGKPVEVYPVFPI